MWLGRDSGWGYRSLLGVCQLVLGLAGLDLPSQAATRYWDDSGADCLGRIIPER